MTHAADMAKLLRETLKQHFPGIKFSVRSESYRGGESLDVEWLDGPSEKEVEAVADVEPFSSQTSGYGSRYVFCRRGRAADEALGKAFAAECRARGLVEQIPKRRGGFIEFIPYQALVDYVYMNPTEIPPGEPAEVTARRAVDRMVEKRGES